MHNIASYLIRQRDMENLLQCCLLKVGCYSLGTVYSVTSKEPQVEYMHNEQSYKNVKSKPKVGGR